MAAAPQDEASRVKLEAWLVTDVGVVREHNEDAAYMEPSKGFFIVADGMGGHAAGEVASAMAVDTVRQTLDGARNEIETFKRAPTEAGRRAIAQLLQSAVHSAHQAVFQRGQHEADKAGMGTTLDVVLIAGPEAFVAHVGDSRTYLVRDGRSLQITTDHTVAEVLVIEGKLTIEEAQVSPLRTILVNAIGVSADVGVEMAHVPLKRGDRLLLCSDGLHDYFPVDDEIAQKLSADAPGDALKDMVELAKTRGGHDNITGVAVQVTDVIDAVPATLEGELTQPVDLQGNNPFAADEPTETAVVDPSGPSPMLGNGASSASELRSTQPMRRVGNRKPADASGSPEKPAKARGSDSARGAAATASPAAARDGTAMSPPPAGSAADALAETTLDSEPVPDDEPAAAPREPTAGKGEGQEKGQGKGQSEGQRKGKPPGQELGNAGKDQKNQDGPAAGPAEASGASAPRATPGGADGVPSEIATADTGRTSVAGTVGKDKGAG